MWCSPIESKETGRRSTKCHSLCFYASGHTKKRHEWILLLPGQLWLKSSEFLSRKTSHAKRLVSICKTNKLSVPVGWLLWPVQLDWSEYTRFTHSSVFFVFVLQPRRAAHAAASGPGAGSEPTLHRHVEQRAALLLPPPDRDLWLRLLHQRRDSRGPAGQDQVLLWSPHGRRASPRHLRDLLQRAYPQEWRVGAVRWDQYKSHAPNMWTSVLVWKQLWLNDAVALFIHCSYNVICN